VLKAAKQLLKCARVDLYSVTQDERELIWHDTDMAATQNLSQSPDLVLKLQGLVGFAVTSRKPVNASPARSHPLFVARVDQRSDRCHPNSTLIVPLLVAQGTLHEASIGAIQATNKLDGTPFDENDQALLQKLALLAANSIYTNNKQNRQARLVTVLSRISTTLNVSMLLHHTVECVRDWSHGKALAIRIWVRDCRTQALVLCALEYACNRPYIRNHLAEDRHQGQARERADESAVDCFCNSRAVMPAKERKDTAVGEAKIYLPLVQAEDQDDTCSLNDSASNLQSDRSPCDAENLGVLQVNYARGTLSLTQVELELLTSIANQCASALVNAELHHEDRRTRQQHEKLFSKAQGLFACKSSAALFRHVCSVVSELAPSHNISIFSVDAEGRHVEGEWTEAGPVSAAVSSGFNLKLKVAIKALQGLALDGDSSLSSLEHDDDLSRKEPHHCFSTLLFKTGVAPRISQVRGAGGGAGGKNASAVDMALFGVLVCIRPHNLGAYVASERQPLESLAGMAAQHMLSMQRSLASKFIGQLKTGGHDKEAEEDHADAASLGQEKPTPIPVPIPKAIPRVAPPKPSKQHDPAAAATPVAQAAPAADMPVHAPQATPPTSTYQEAAVPAAAAAPGNPALVEHKEAAVAAHKEEAVPAHKEEAEAGVPAPVPFEPALAEARQPMAGREMELKERETPDLKQAPAPRGKGDDTLQAQVAQPEGQAEGQDFAATAPAPDMRVVSPALHLRPSSPAVSLRLPVLIDDDDDDDDVVVVVVTPSTLTVVRTGDGGRHIRAGYASCA